MDALTRYRSLLDQLQALRRLNPVEESPAEEQVLVEMRQLWPWLTRDNAVRVWQDEQILDQRIAA